MNLYYSSKKNDLSKMNQFLGKQNIQCKHSHMRTLKNETKTIAKLHGIENAVACNMYVIVIDV